MPLQLWAARTLLSVIDKKASLDDALAQYGKHAVEQHGALQELCYGGCRFYFYFDAILTRLLKKPIKDRDRIVHFLLVVALYQITQMRTPDHAAVNQCVKALAKTNQSWAKGLVNGVLRRFLREQDTLTKDIHLPHEQFAFPAFFAELIDESWPEFARDILAASNQRPPMTLRVNHQRTQRGLYGKQLTAAKLAFSLTADSDMGIILDQPVPVTELPGFADGQVSVQDESAQLVTDLMGLRPGLKVLDGCAAPGGKTCAMLESEPELASMTALDFPKRMTSIQQNLDRLSLNATLISEDLTHFDTWWDGQLFDRILLDVPCSGSGVIRRHPDIKHRRRKADFNQFAERQLAILDSAWKMLAPGGLLVYVTCSVMNCENDGVIGQFSDRTPDVDIQHLDDKLGIQTQFGRQRLPGVHQGDGFYYCRLAKRP